MSIELQRREFLVGMAVASGTWLGGCTHGGDAGGPDGSPRAVASVLPGASPRSPSEPAELAFVAGSYQPVGWSCQGGSSWVRVTARGLSLSLRGAPSTLYTLDDFALGRGYEEIRRAFGDATLQHALQVGELLRHAG